MIPTATLLYELDQRLNRVATNKHQSIPLEDKVLVLDNAQIKLIKQKVSLNNPYREGLDSFKKRYEDLQNIIEPHEPLQLSKDNKALNKYITSLNSAKNPVMFLIDAYFICSKGNCTNRLVVGNQVRHADIHRVLANSTLCPSFEYQESVYTITKDNLEFYTDGTFTPNSANISYIRYPKEIDFPGYFKLDETESTLQDCELEFYLKDELLDIATQDLAMSTENDQQVQYSRLRSQNNE